MADNLSLQLDDKRVRRALEALSKTDRSQAVSKGLRSGIKPVYNAEKTLVRQHQSGRKKKDNRKSLYQSMSTNLKTSRQRIYVGFKRGAGYGGAVSHLVESGTVKRYTKSGHYTGSVRKGAPQTGWKMAETAFQVRGDQAIEILLETLKKWILGTWH